MRHTMVFAAAALVLGASPAMALDLDKAKVKELNQMADKPLLENVNKALADQQIKDGQFEFKTGKAEFAPGNEKRVDGLLKVLTDNSKALKTAFPNLKVTTEGHTDAVGKPDANKKLSLARAKKVCSALKVKGMKLPCVPTGVGSSKPLVSPEKTEADKQRNRRVLVQVAK
jgi:outer membrane protein OmpA-like peptidoglycan-associated protein